MIIFLIINNSNKDLFTVGSQVSNSIEGGIGEQEHSENINHPTLLNIYGEPLEKCKTGSNEPNKQGSWDLDGYCSEMGGGVHQICFDVTKKRSNFSSITGQSNWSEGRVGNNHCMCLGAWALYKAKDEGDDDELICDAIPEQSLTSDYIDNWNTWNGNELPNQIIDGVDSLVLQCYNKQDNNELKENLKEKYDILRSNYNIEWNSII